MKAVIKIRMDNAAFSDGLCGLELARILRKLADKMEYLCDIGARELLMDGNGNRVGLCEIKEG